MDKNKPENMKNPWKILRQRRVYKNDWMGIKECDVIRPDGKNGIYAYMECRPAVGIIPLDSQGNTWLVGQYRFPVKKYSWEIPTGMGESGESLKVTAKRELREETGVTAQDIIELGFFHTSIALTDEVATLYLGLECTIGEPSFDPTEDLEIKKISFTKVLDMCSSGEITDSMSIIGLQLAKRYLSRDNDI